jgi:hypothetical protein
MNLLPSLPVRLCVECTWHLFFPLPGVALICCVERIKAHLLTLKKISIRFSDFFFCWNHVSTLMAKECRKLSPSTDLQCIAITPGAPLSPSPRNEKKKKRKHVKTLVEEIFFYRIKRKLSQCI